VDNFNLKEWLIFFNSPGIGEVLGRSVAVAAGSIWIEYFSKIRQWVKKPKGNKLIIDNKAALHGTYAHIVLGLFMTLFFGFDKETNQFMHVLDLMMLFFMYGIFSGAIHMMIGGYLKWRKKRHGNGK